jgi:hypothetical protein
MAGTALVHLEAVDSGVKAVRGEISGRWADVSWFRVPRRRRNGP